MDVLSFIDVLCRTSLQPTQKLSFIVIYFSSITIRYSFNLCTIKQLCDRGAKNSILHFSCDVLTYTSSYLNDKNQRYTSANCWHLVCPEKLFQSVSVFVRDDIQMEWYQSFAQTSLCSSITWSWTKIRDVGVEVIWCY